MTAPQTQGTLRAGRVCVGGRGSATYQAHAGGGAEEEDHANKDKLRYNSVQNCVLMENHVPEVRARSRVAIKFHSRLHLRYRTASQEYHARNMGAECFNSTIRFSFDLVGVQIVDFIV